MTTATIDAQVNARWIAIWLAVCAATILGMILLGGVTRLTESGLSMVDWRPQGSRLSRIGGTSGGKRAEV